MNTNDMAMHVVKALADDEVVFDDKVGWFRPERIVIGKKEMARHRRTATSMYESGKPKFYGISNRTHCGMRMVRFVMVYAPEEEGYTWRYATGENATRDVCRRCGRVRYKRKRMGLPPLTTERPDGIGDDEGKQ